MKCFYKTACFLAGSLLLAQAAEAYTSNYASVSVAGLSNNFDTSIHPMALISNGVWQKTVPVNLTNGTPYLFATPGYTHVWKETNQTWFGPWQNGIATTGGVGNNLSITGSVQGTLRFTLDENTRVYRVEALQTNEVAWTSQYSYVNLAGSFNDYDTQNTNMVLISNGVWQSYVSLQNATNPAFLFATRDFTNTWKEQNQSISNLPLEGLAEYASGTNITLSGVINGTLRFQFNEYGNAYRVENVTAGTTAGDVWINEIHYDHAGTDTNEFIEVAGQAGVNLGSYSLLLYNGNNGTLYNTRTLSGTIPNQANGFGAVRFSYSDTIQNGAPDGLALVKNGSTVLEFLSYEGQMTAVGGAANGLSSTAIGVEESSGTPVDASLQRVGTGAQGPAFTWVGPAPGSPGQINDGQLMQIGTPAASVVFSNLVRTPTAPSTGDTVHLDVDIVPTHTASSNLTATAFYRINSNGLFRPLPMSRTNAHFRTLNPIPKAGGGSTVEYYIFVNFTGTGTNSPQVYPAAAPATVLSYGVTAVGSGQVWINEINPVYDDFDYDQPQDYLELAGLAGADISGWQIEIYNSTNDLQDRYVLPAGTILPNTYNGFGFYVLGMPTVANVDAVMTNTLPDFGLARLLNEFGLLQQAIYWEGNGLTGGPFDGYTYAGTDPSTSTRSLSLGGLGGNFSSFYWELLSVNEESPGGVNTEQSLTGGNTNALPPYLVCPSNLLFGCADAAVPTANVALVTATGLCGNGSVTVTWVGDTTNAGSGCLGSPKVVERTYRAVSACGTTSECVQTITLEDRSPPVLVCHTNTLTNPGFEFGDLTGWTTFGDPATNLNVGSTVPYANYRHATLRGPFSSTLRDGTGGGFDGLIINHPSRQQAGATAGTALSIRFNGTNQYAEVPFYSPLNQASFTVAFWAHPGGLTNRDRVTVASRHYASGVAQGYFIQASLSNRWEVWTGNGTTWDILSGPGVATGAWTHVVATFETTNKLKQLWINGVKQAEQKTTNYAVNASRPLRLAAGATETTATNFFAGLLDDVQLYDRAFTTSQVASLYNAGLGGVEVGEPLAHYALDELGTTSVNTSGFHQALPAASGQVWTASAFAYIPPADPLQGSNQFNLQLQYIGSTGGVVLAVTSSTLRATSPVGVYTRLLARATAPSNAVQARLLVAYRQDTNSSNGSVYLDAAVLSTLSVASTNGNCPVMPDLRSLVSASDTCSSVTISQTPAIGATLVPTNTTVYFVARDACGSGSECSLPLTIIEETPPVIVSYVTSITVSCLSAVPAPTPSSVVAVDGCGSVTLSHGGDTTNAGLGCAGSTQIISRTYVATDQFGNSSSVVQRINIADTNRPTATCSASGPLVNAGFDTGTLSGWSTFGSLGPNLVVTNALPYSGTHSARVMGQFNGGLNYSGFYQDLAARPGQLWRATARLHTPTNNPLTGTLQVVTKVEFLGSTGLLAEYIAPTFTTNSPVGVYVPVTVTGVAPEGATSARLAVVFIQETNTAGMVYVDGCSLSLTEVALGSGCYGVLPDLTYGPTFSDCGSVTVTQSPLPGVSLALGTTNVLVHGRDPCNLSSTCSVSVTVLDLTSPVITAGPTNLTVATTNQVPAVDTNALTVVDCTSVQVTHLGDHSNGGAGTTNSPLILVRTYQALDRGTNAALWRQIITVSGGSDTPPAPTNVTVRAISMGNTSIVVRSLGTNTWSVAPEYATNLISPTWLPISNSVNNFSGGTNVTSFGYPVTNPGQGIIIRIWQRYP